MEYQPFSGSIHSHGFWTDYRNKAERREAPFNLSFFANTCQRLGRKFQAITDLMVAKPGSEPFIEHRFEELLKTADSAVSDMYVENKGKEAIIYFGEREPFVIPRTQEIVTARPGKHILVINVEGDIRGGKNTLDTLKEIKDAGGTAIVNHPFMRSAWSEEELLKFYKESLIGAIEWNGGLTFPSWCKCLPFETPNKSSNQRVKALESQIPLISNDDSHCISDVKNGAYATYSLKDAYKGFSESIVNAISQRDFQRVEAYSGFFSPVKHVLNARKSRKLFGVEGLPFE